MKRLSFIFLFSLLSLAACKVFDRPEPVPGFILFRDPQVVVDSTVNFISPLGPKDAWFYLGGQYYGTFPFNTAFPIDDPNEDDLFIEGGVYESGLSAYRIRYPFWKPIQYYRQSSALDTLIIQPTFEYYSDTFITFSYLEDFESQALQFTPLTTADTANLNRSTGDPFEGTHCGIIRFDSVHHILDIASDELPAISKNVDIWAEVTYRSTLPFNAGLFYFSPQPRRVAEVTITPKNEWNTVYIHLVKMIRDAPTDPSIRFRLWFYTDSGTATGQIEFDYIRVVQMKE